MLGLHFFSPVPVMKLVEIVVGLDTDATVVERADAFAEQIGKHPIHTKDRSGFIVNMLLVPYLMAAVRMYEDGFASREDIDDGMKLGAGHPMGPLTLCDFIGLDVLYAVCDSLYEEFKRPEYAPPPLLKRMVVVRPPRPQDRPRLLRVRLKAGVTAQAGTGARRPTADDQELLLEPRSTQQAFVDEVVDARRGGSGPAVRAGAGRSSARGPRSAGPRASRSSRSPRTARSARGRRRSDAQAAGRSADRSPRAGRAQRSKRRAGSP